MPTRNRPKLKMRAFSRQDQAMILLFLTDRLKVNEYALKRAAAMWDAQKDSYTTQNMLYQKNVNAAIKWLIHTCPITRNMTAEQIGGLLGRKVAGVGSRKRPGVASAK